MRLHASGIHQDGILKARDTYEIMRAEDVGWSANKIVLVNCPVVMHSVSAWKNWVSRWLRSRCERRILPFKELADRKAEIFDEDILALVSDGEQANEVDAFHFVSLSQRSETGEFHRRKLSFRALVKNTSVKQPAMVRSMQS
jgi:2-isopropylmalate synthase